VVDSSSSAKFLCLNGLSRPKGGLSWRTATAVRNFLECLRLRRTLIVREAKFPYKLTSSEFPANETRATDVIVLASANESTQVIFIGKIRWAQENVTPKNILQQDDKNQCFAPRSFRKKSKTIILFYAFKTNRQTIFANIMIYAYSLT